MSRFTAIVPLVNHPFEHVPNIFAASTDDPQSLITTLGYIDDLAYPPNITTPEFVAPPIPLLRTSDILYIISSANTIKLFGVYFVVQVGQSFQLVLTPSGGNVQPHSLALDSIAGLITAANQMIYTTAPNTYATSPITALALTLMSNATQAQMQATLGIITLTPSDPLKTFIASVDSPVIVGQLARFVDVNGTIQSSGILVTDILLRANNLNDLANVVTARLNLGLGSAALQDITFFLQSSNNLSDLMNVVTARTNLGLGSAATQDNSFFLQVLNNLSDLNNTATARNNLGLGSAAIKAASDASKPNLASINGSTIINNIAIFSDINGTIVDSGTTITGFQPLSPALSSIASLVTSADQMLYTTASNVYNTTSLTAFSRGLLALTSAATWRTGLGLGTAATQNSTFFLQVANNLSDLASVSTARTNLGLGTAALQNIAFFLQSANNLSDLVSAATARTNLGLGTAAVQNVAFFLQSANNLSDVANAATSRTNLGLGTSATKTASDNTKTNVASINGATIINNIAIFSDINGTIVDSGTTITGFQPLSPALSSIASLVTSADQMLYTTASNVYNTTSLTAFSRGLLALTSAATWQTGLGLGTAALKSASDVTKTNLASINGATVINNIAVFSDVNGTIQDSGSSITAFQPLNAALTSISGLVTAANQMIYTTASNTYAVTSLTAFSRTLLSNTSASIWQTTLGLGTAATKAASDNTKATLASVNSATVVGHVATFSDTAGTVTDGGVLGTAAAKAASNNAQATVASVSGIIVSGHVATFNDTVGTIADGGLLGTAAFKTVSNNALAGVASTSGSFVVNNIVVAADTSGSIKDGGAAISGFVLSTRTLTAAGLVTGGGDLSADRSFTVTAATQTTQEAATSNTVAVTPGSQLYHPSSIKASGTLHEAASPSWLQQYNFTTIVRNSAGSYTVTMAVTFSSANYQVVCTPNDGTELVWSVDQKTTTTFRVRSWTLAGIVLADGDFGIMVTGDLA